MYMWPYAVLCSAYVWLIAWHPLGWLHIRLAGCVDVARAYSVPCIGGLARLAGYSGCLGGSGPFT